jgi:hypothetical protein
VLKKHGRLSEISKERTLMSFPQKRLQTKRLSHFQNRIILMTSMKNYKVLTSLGEAKLLNGYMKMMKSS